jgi:hypothetical protein
MVYGRILKPRGGRVGDALTRSAAGVPRKLAATIRRPIAPSVTRAEVAATVITMIEIPRFAGKDGLAAAWADHVTASDSRTPKGAKLAMDGSVLAVVHRVTRLAPAVTKAEPIPARYRGKEQFAAGLSALHVARHGCRPISGRDFPGRGWKALATLKNGLAMRVCGALYVSAVGIVFGVVGLVLDVLAGFHATGCGRLGRPAA